VAKRVVGIDLSKEGINYLKSKGFLDLFVIDIENEDIGKKINGRFDIILAGEILEHLSNPGIALNRLNLFMEDDAILVITVPNTFYIGNIVRNLFGKEFINRDHVAYYSPATIDHLCRRFNFEIINVFYSLLKPANYKGRFLFPMKILLQRLIPYLSDGIIFIVKKKIDALEK
jgi:2-polyprenyl-3-methyl-5-hydroxy-6-metoxy-1,4-benzoquinol methylase